MFKIPVKYFNFNVLTKYYDFIIGRKLSDNNITVNIFHRYKPSINVPMELFQGLVDRFNGVTIDSQKESETCENFPDKLEKSLNFWKEKQNRGIWFRVHTENSDWVPILAKKGFNFHHAKKGFVMMYKWLPENEIENIPEYAHTMIGVGGLVINEKNEVLAVSEKYSLIANSWKLPGGYVEPKEDLIDAAIREVKEETGIETEFETLISFRHGHGGGFNCSDIYIVIGLIPKTTELIRCEREIANIKWIPIDEFLNDPNVHEGNRHFVKTYLKYKEYGIKFDCDKVVHQILKKPYCSYYVKKKNQ